MYPNPYPANRLSNVFLAASLAAALLSGGCASKSDDEMTKGVVSGERPVAMEGSAPFFGGKVIAKVTVSRGVGKGLKSGGKRGGEKATYDAYANSEGKLTLGSPLPPVTLHLLLSNTGTEEVSVKMLDFNSELGNFVIDPDILKIPPGQTAEPTPMVSQLGVSSDELPFSVRLEVGNTREEHTIAVRNLLETAKPANGSS
jgi:hypothetical protein